ncbi:MAG: hypothetical protein K2W78_12730 [Xanthobacteraceae bacterium]|nr:hypothetical protein [Xanthobacteraceae bacterium]
MVMSIDERTKLQRVLEEKRRAPSGSLKVDRLLKVLIDKRRVPHDGFAVRTELLRCVLVAVISDEIALDRHPTQAAKAKKLLSKLSSIQSELEGAIFSDLPDLALAVKIKDSDLPHSQEFLTVLQRLRKFETELAGFKVSISSFVDSLTVAPDRRANNREDPFIRTMIELAATQWNEVFGELTHDDRADFHRLIATILDDLKFPRSEAALFEKRLYDRIGKQIFGN